MLISDWFSDGCSSGLPDGGQQAVTRRREHATTGDGLLTAVRFLSLAAANGVSVKERSEERPVGTDRRGGAVPAARSDLRPTSESVLRRNALKAAKSDN